jgi:hypothetical protein
VVPFFSPLFWLTMTWLLRVKTTLKAKTPLLFTLVHHFFVRTHSISHPSFPEKMNSENSKLFPPSKQPPQGPQLNLQRAFSDLQNHCSNLLQHLPNPSSLKTQFQSAVSNFQNHAKHALDPKILASSYGKNPVWARIAEPNKTQLTTVRQSGAGGALSAEAIEERLAGVPVYALSNAVDEFVLVSGVSTRKSLGLFCFKKEDAEALLEQIRSMDPSMQSGSKVVAVALNKVGAWVVEFLGFTANQCIFRCLGRE